MAEGKDFLPGEGRDSPQGWAAEVSMKKGFLKLPSNTSGGERPSGRRSVSSHGKIIKGAESFQGFSIGERER